jgi:type I restriction enzyme, S subunit
MIDEARPYAEYKSTEVPWLGDIPAHWEVQPLRTLLKQRNEKNRPLKTRQILSLSIAHGVTLYSHEGRGGNKSKSDLTAYKIARKGDIVLNSMNVVVGAVGLSKYTGAISPVYYALYPLSDNVDIHYYNAVFSNHTFQRYLLIYGKGILIKEGDSGKLNTIRMKISSDDLKTIPLPLPTPEEQTAIARFLNWKTVQVKRFIRNRRRLIEVLSEQKQAIINRAVTRGLDPNAPLKPSGIDWLGDIPDHWEKHRLKFLVRNVNEQTSTQQADEVYVALEHVEGWTGRITLPSENIEFDSQVKRFHVGDVLFGKLRPYLAKVTRPIVKGVCVGEFLVLRRKSEALLPEFLEQKLRSKLFIDIINSATFGAKMPRANWAFIGNLVIVYPPTHGEQLEILSETGKQTASLQAAIDKAKREIDLIREYRIRLISDVVTGKMEVRHLAPPPGGEDLEEMVEAFEPPDDDPGELYEEIMDGEVSHADD